MKRILIPTVCIAAVLTLTPSASADKQVGASFDLPIHINATVDETGCKNSPGPNVTLSGEITLGSLNARLTLSNNTKGTHQATVNTRYDVALFLGGNITI